MIVKMKFLSITGPRADIDRMTNRYLSKYEMQLENALTELKTVDNLMPFLEMNPYRDPLAKVTQFLGYMKDMPAAPSFDQSEDEILEMIRLEVYRYMRQTPLPQAQALQPVLVTLQQLLLPVFPASVAVLP